MIFFLFLGILFFLIGYVIKLSLREPSVTSCNAELSEDGLAAKFGADVEKSEKITRCLGFFDSLSVFIGSDTNTALEEIFDIIIDNYIVYWYKTLSTDPGFLIQVRMYLQFMSAALIHRVQCIDLSEFTVQRLIPAIFHHVEHLLEVLSRTTTADSMLEETVLRSLGSHLHICMASRSAELAYLRALVHRLLPHVSMPPALLPLSKAQSEQTLHILPNTSPFSPHQRPGSPRTLRNHPPHGRWATKSDGFDHFASHRSASIGSAFSRQPPWIRLDANRGAYSFLIEILSTCVLLPAMDAVANPDFINKLILSGLGETADSDFADSGRSTLVPVLNTYVQAWTEWMAQKPLSNVRLENLLQQQDDLYPFTQFMKSNRSTEPLTVVLLMNDIDRRVRHEPLTSDSCRELRAQIWHILALLRGSTRTAVEEDGANHGLEEDDGDTESADSRLATPKIQNMQHGMRLLNVPTEFDQLLIDVLKKPDPLTLSRAIRTSYWKDVYRAVSEIIEKRYLPMYIESPEYLSHMLGISYRFMGPCPGSPTSPLNPRKNDASSSSAQAGAGSGLFGNPLKNMFSAHTVEGRLVQDLTSNSARPQVRLATRSNTKLANRAANLRDRIAEASSSSSAAATAGTDQSTILGSTLSLDPQHQLHSHYLLSSHQVDMSDWNVYIPGLSRPEVQPGRRLIDQLTANTSTTSPPTTRASQDSSSFRMRLFDDTSSTGSTNRTAQLSPQFMFTVRTERVVDGVRHQIARVDRKYSEFYVLEQKLLEFHGNAISKQLPRRQYVPRTFEFMESKREEFEEYLQFLLSQPFLRKSELLFTFITSKTPFNTSLLFDLNFGRLVKSVPLKLAKEKGQFLDDFLVSFYVSCSPQPILLEPVEPRPRSNTTVVTVLPSSGVGTLGGIDSLASPDHYSINPTSDATSVRRRASDFITSATDSSKQSVPVAAPAVASSSSANRPAKCTMLDNRLRARAYWNNAGWSLDRRKELVDRRCVSRVVIWKGLTETLLYLFHSLSEPTPAEPLLTPPPLPEKEVEERPAENSGNQTASDFLSDPVSTHDPWDVSHAAWSEAFLNGPVLPDDQLVTKLRDPGHVKPESSPNSSDKNPPRDHSQCQSMTKSKVKTSVTGNPQISITLVDCLSAIVQAARLVHRHLALQFRYFILWASFQLWYHLRVPIDHWLANYLVSYLRTCAKDGYVAYALRLLKTSIFFPYVPSTDVEKSQRKDQALAAVQRTILKMGFAYISNREMVEQRLTRVFLCFQQPKWNKQLSYVLLDHLVTSLFPELMMTSADSSRTEVESAAAAVT